MKKFTLTLLLLLAGIPTLFAQQTVRNDIFAYLKHEGYAPALDKDSDIEFKIQGILYNIIVKQIENEDYAYVEVLANFGTVTPYDKLTEIANRHKPEQVRLQMFGLPKREQERLYAGHGIRHQQPGKYRIPDVACPAPPSGMG